MSLKLFKLVKLDLVFLWNFISGHSRKRCPAAGAADRPPPPRPERGPAAAVAAEAAGGGLAGGRAQVRGGLHSQHHQGQGRAVISGIF